MRHVRIGTWAVLAACICGLARGQDSSGWIGKRVIDRDNNTFALKIGNQVVATGDSHHVYTVERVNGQWLWLVSGNTKGWAPASEVLLVEDAPRYYTDYIRLHPEDLRWAYHRRGLAWDAKGERDMAIADFSEAIRQDPSVNYSYLSRGICYYDKGEYDRAIADYNEALRLDPNDSMVYYERGLANRAKHDHDRAIADFGQAMRANPNDTMAYYHRALVWADKGESDRAIADLSEVLRLEPKDSDALERRAIEYNHKREFDRALADYSALLAIQPKNAWAHESRGISLMGKGDWQSAADAFARAMEVNDYKESTSMYSAILENCALRRGGKTDEAKSRLEAVAPKLEANLWPYPIVKYLRGEIDKAALSAAAVDNDKQTEVHFYIGYGALIDGDKEKAREEFKWVKEHGPKSFIEYGLAGVELDRLGG